VEGNGYGRGPAATTDRVAPWDVIANANAPGSLGYLQVGPAAFRRADPLGPHVLVPRAVIDVPDEPHRLLMAQLQLAVVDDSAPVCLEVVLPMALFLQLPHAGRVLRTIEDLVPDLDLMPFLVDGLVAGVEVRSDDQE
jgi:hypothetical protein